MKKTLKIVMAFVAVLLLLGVMFLVNGAVGNPISQMVVEKNAKTYVETTYPNTDYYVARVQYSFKIGGYYAYIKSRESQDTYFSVMFDFFGNAGYDNFSSYVSDGFNTWNRINDAYRTATESILQSLPYETSIEFGEIQTEDKGNNRLDFGIDMQSLVLDKVYPLEEIGKTYGKITLYVENQEVSIAKMMEILRTVKSAFLEKDQFFYAIDLVLRTPKTQDKNLKEWEKDWKEIRVECFLYQDISETDFEPQLKEALLQTNQYFENLNGQKATEATKTLN